MNCRFCNKDLYKPNNTYNEVPFSGVPGMPIYYSLKDMPSPMWFCGDCNYCYEILNQISENCYEYEERIMFSSCTLVIKQPHDIWELRYDIKERIHKATGGTVVIWNKLLIEPFSLSSLEEIKKKLEVYITFS